MPVFVYNSDDPTNAKGCDAVNRWNQARQLLQQEYGESIYIDLKVFPQYSTCPGSSGINGWHQYGPASARQNFSTAPGDGSFSISPGYWKAGTPYGTAPFLARDLARWQSDVAAMNASIAKWQLITTFNEWGRGHRDREFLRLRRHGPDGCDVRLERQRHDVGLRHHSPQRSAAFLTELVRDRGRRGPIHPRDQWPCRGRRGGPTMTAMPSPVQVPSAVRRHRSFDAFAGAHRVVFEQVRAFYADPDFAMPSLGGASPEVREGTLEQSRVEADYYDTADLDLAAAGLAVRWHPHTQEWIALLPVVSVTGQPIRCAAGFPGTAGVVPDAIQRLLHLHLHRRPLERVAHVDSHRLTRPLISATGIRLADVVDEHVVATRVGGDRQAHRCVRVEVVDLDGLGRSVLSDVCALLTRSGCRIEAPAADLARAFGSTPWSR
jgi:hypothetical protein